MQLTVNLSGQDTDWITVNLRLQVHNADEHCACLRHVTAHRPTRLAVLSADFQAWRAAQRRGDISAAQDLLQDVTLLWDQMLVWNQCGSIFQWQDTMAKSVVALQLVERLRWSERIDDVLITLEQLLLEKEFNQLQGDGRPADSDAPAASVADRHHAL
jgi:hypothetical protein